MDTATKWVMDIVCGFIILAIVVGACLVWLGQNSGEQVDSAVNASANNNVSNVSTR